MFSIRIDTSQVAPLKDPFEQRQYDADLDDLTSRITDGCELLQECGARFDVDGFGLQWPVDVSTDLATILPQIDAAIGALANGKDFRLDFFEQGIERTVIGTHRGDLVALRCGRLSGSEMLGSEEVENPQELATQLRNVKAAFCGQVRALTPPLAADPLFCSWCDLNAAGRTGVD
jgi:hypothetical protein